MKKFLGIAMGIVISAAAIAQSDKYRPETQHNSRQKCRHAIQRQESRAHQFIVLITHLPPEQNAEKKHQHHKYHPYIPYQSVSIRFHFLLTPRTCQVDHLVNEGNPGEHPHHIMMLVPEIIQQHKLCETANKHHPSPQKVQVAILPELIPGRLNH